MRQLFISYARENKGSVQELVRHLENLGYESWVDSSLRGGQTWWNEILRQISQCDAFLVMVSRSSLNSVACKRELKWALALGKPILPVAVERLPEALPRDLSMLQIVDYSEPGQQSAFALAGALAALPSAPPLPTELPEAPPPPLSYLTDLIDQVSQSDPLTHPQQRQILVQLQPSLSSADPEERKGGHYILEMFSKRDDLYADVARALGQWGIGKQEATEPLVPAAGPEAVPAPDSAASSEQPKPPRSQEAVAVTAAGPPTARAASPLHERIPSTPPQESWQPAPPRRGAPALIWTAVILLAAAVIGVTALLVIPRLGRNPNQSNPVATTPSTSVEPTETVPSNARTCPSIYPDTEFRVSAIGSNLTSCQFAEEVRREYISQPSRGAKVLIEARSPVTGQTYGMTCTGRRVVTCTGGTSAVVYIY